MKTAILGSGGREHALAWKMAQSVGWDHVFTLPGNGGIPNSFALDISDFNAIEKFCVTQQIELIIVGPEQPLALGIVDYFRKTDINIFGPTQHAAQLESSKVFAKNFMQKYGVKTAHFAQFTNLSEALAYTNMLHGNCVLKYDGLAAGKGVFVCEDLEQCHTAFDEMEEQFGSDSHLVVEQRLVGDEMSVIGFTDGTTIKLLQPSQDHKQLLEGDIGANTGGMGAYSPIEKLNPELMYKIQNQIITPTLKGLQAENFDYRGFIYFGIMVEKGIPYLLEYNTRLGDPEAEVLLPALQTDFLTIIQKCIDKSLKTIDLEFLEGYFSDVVLVSGGYPKKFETGLTIVGLNTLPDDILVFHGGTQLVNNELVTSGGRVLNIVAQGKTLNESFTKIYTAIKNIHFDKMYFRKDIGKRKNIELTNFKID